MKPVDPSVVAMSAMIFGQALAETIFQLDPSAKGKLIASLKEAIEHQRVLNIETGSTTYKDIVMFLSGILEDTEKM